MAYDGQLDVHCSLAQWSSRMIRASGGFPATKVVKMYVTRVQFPVEPIDFPPRPFILFLNYSPHDDLYRVYHIDTGSLSQSYPPRGLNVC